MSVEDNTEERAEHLLDNVENEENKEVAETEVKTWQIVDENETTKPFIPNVEETVEETVETEEEKVVDLPIEEIVEEVVQPTIDEDTAIKFLAEKKGMSVDEFKDSLIPKEKEVLDPETEAYLKYRKETGRGYSDFQQTQKEWDKEPQENVLRHILKMKYPDLDADEIEFKFRKQYSYDESIDDDDEIMEKKINLKTDYREGLELLEKQKEQYKVVRGSDEYVPEDYRKAKELVDNWQTQQKENETAMTQARLDFEAKTNEVFTDKFEGFKYKVGNEEFTLKPEDVNQTKSVLSDVSNFDKKFFDKTGKLKDPQGYYKALHAGMYADQLFEKAFNLGKVAQAEFDEKESKNIQVDGTKHVNSRMGESSKTWKVVKD